MSKSRKTKKDDIIFNVIDWNDLDDFDEEDDCNNFDSFYNIEAYGRTEEGNSVYLKVTNFTPYFFVEIPRSWKKQDASKFINFIKSKTYGKYQSSLIEYDIVKKHRLYGFTAGKRFKFIRLIFNTYEAMRKYRWIFNSKHRIPGLDSSFREYKAYEPNFPPLLRFMHIQNIDASGWIKVPKDKYTKLSKRCYNVDIAIEAKWTDIIGVEKQSISKIRIASYDLECTSGDGSFPQANRDTDKIIQIGTTFSYNGAEECYFKHIITLGSCSEIEGATVESYETEDEVILAWQKLIINQDPDIITGYNIYGFDNKYIHDRAQYLGIEDQFGIFSRLRNFKCEYVDTQLSSSALGDNKIRYYKTPGRIQIDLMKVVMRDYKLNSYKLDSVAEEFLNGKVLSYNENKIEVDSSKDLHEGGYIKFIESDGELVEDGKKFKIESIEGNKVILHTSPNTDDNGLKWTMAKDDVKPQDIFRLQKGSVDDRRIVAEYCIQDCALVNKLIARLCVVINSIGMSNVCIVPLSYLFLRGQGIKIFSLVAKECRQMNYLIPNLKRDKNTEHVGYEGATVFVPEIGFYKRPIAVLDYASLYPSSMIHKNLSHETFVDNAKYDNHPDYIYYDCEYNNADGTKTKCRYAKNKNGEMGVMPMILDKLLKQRKSVKKLMTNAEDPFMKSIYDGLQLAYKMTANSLYGQIGSSVSPIYFKQIAASTTSTGREMLELARDYMENVFPGIVHTLYERFTENNDKKIKKLLDDELVESLHTNEFIDDVKEKIIKVMNKCTIKPKTVYGDSVTSDTPILLRKNNMIYIKTIETLCEEWTDYNEFKSNESDLYNKEQSKTEFEVWTYNKWTKIKRVIRHKTNKKIYRINTHQGIVDITEDHSLLDENKQLLKPIECNENTKLLQSYPSFVDDNKLYNLEEIVDKIYNYNMNEKTDNELEAYIFGFFFGDGSCGRYNSKCSYKYSWALNNNDLLLLMTLKEILERLYDCEFSINNTINSSGVYKLVPKGSIKYMVNKYRPMFYDKDNYKIIPDKIINGSYEERFNFFLGYYAADGGKCPGEKSKSIRFSNKGKIGTAHLYYLVRSLGYQSSLSIRSDKSDIFRISCCIGDIGVRKQRVVSNKIKKNIYIKNTENNEYVYDLETEEGIFNAGIGEIIVKNTDSVFIDFGLKIDDNYYETKEALEFAIDLGVIAGNFIKKRLHKPQDLEYEKTFYPFCILSKKRYVGNKYEFDKNKFKQNSMGIVLKRRDNARIVKKVVGGMVDILLNEVNVDKAVDYIKNCIVDLLKGKYPLHNFVTSKTLKANYKDRTRIAHVCLADRMKEREPGSAPQINERVPYAYIVVPPKKGLLQGDRIEHPDYILENSLQVDYLFYLTNQIKNPTVQFLELLVDDPDSMFNEAIQIENNKRAGNVSIARFFNVKKGKIKELSDLVIKRKTKSKPMAKYYLNDDRPDMEKLGLDYSSEDDNEDNDISDDEKESENKNNSKYKKLFLDLGRI